MKQLKVSNGKITVTSKDVADTFGKINTNVMRDIRKIIEMEPEFGALNFELSSYTSKQNKTLECYEMTSNGFSVLAMGFSGESALKWKIKYMEAFEQMRKTLNTVIPVMEDLNTLTKQSNSDKDKASLAGSILSKYKKVGPENKRLCDEAYAKVQMSLGFEQ